MGRQARQWQPMGAQRPLYRSASCRQVTPPRTPHLFAPFKAGARFLPQTPLPGLVFADGLTTCPVFIPLALCQLCTFSARPQHQLSADMEPSPLTSSVTSSWLPARSDLSITASYIFHTLPSEHYHILLLYIALSANLLMPFPPPNPECGEGMMIFALTQHCFLCI